MYRWSTARQSSRDYVIGPWSPVVDGPSSIALDLRSRLAGGADRGVAAARPRGGKNGAAAAQGRRRTVRKPRLPDPVCCEGVVHGDHQRTDLIGTRETVETYRDHQSRDRQIHVQGPEPEGATLVGPVGAELIVRCLLDAQAEPALLRRRPLNGLAGPRRYQAEQFRLLPGGQQPARVQRAVPDRHLGERPDDAACRAPPGQRVAAEVMPEQR